MSGFPVVIRSSSKMFNKASQSDLRKLSSFLQKDVKKLPTHSGSCWRRWYDSPRQVEHTNIGLII